MLQSVDEGQGPTCTTRIPMTGNPASVSTSFQKVRADHAKETAQDYVEAVAEIAFRDG